ncbi:MAG: tail fiber domain-containing protein, partial [Flavobacteriales bacterium]
PTGYFNTAVGSKAMYANVTGYRSSAFGYNALTKSLGSQNTAAGAEASAKNTTGEYNTSVGAFALYSNTTGSGNTALGLSALGSNTGNGEYNTGVGYSSLAINTIGRYNTGVGFSTMANNTTGNNNTAIGRSAGASVDGISNTTAVGYDARPTATNMVRVGNTLVTSINGAVNFTLVSDARFKRELRTDVQGLDFILALKPMTYTYDVKGLRAFLKEGFEKDKDGNEVRVSDPEIDQAIAEKEAIRYSGFLAQDVEKAAQAVGYDFSGVDAPKNGESLYGLRYAEFVVPLVKAVQEQQALIERLEERIRQLEVR